MNQTPMGLPSLVLDTLVFLLVFMLFFRASFLFQYLIGDMPLGAPRPNALIKVLDRYILVLFFVLFFSMLEPHFFSVIGDIPLGAPRPNALMKGI